MPSVFRYLHWMPSCPVRTVKEGFPEGSSEYLSVPPLSMERQSCAEGELSCAEMLLHTSCHIVFKAFRAAREELRTLVKSPQHFLTLSWHTCAGVTAGLQYGQRCLAAAELEDTGHRDSAALLQPNACLG